MTPLALGQIIKASTTIQNCNPNVTDPMTATNRLSRFHHQPLSALNNCQINAQAGRTIMKIMGMTTNQIGLFRRHR